MMYWEGYPEAIARTRLLPPNPYPFSEKNNILLSEEVLKLSRTGFESRCRTYYVISMLSIYGNNHIIAVDVSLPNLYWTTNSPRKPNSLGFAQDLCILNDTSVYL